MNPKKPIHFSDYFGIDKSKLDELGVFDPILNVDTKVFVEPLLLKNSSSEIIKRSYESYKAFFAALLRLLQKSVHVDDRCWRAAKKMVHFPEYQYSCIGYSSGNTEGRGFGTEFNDRILQSAKEIGVLSDKTHLRVKVTIKSNNTKYNQSILDGLPISGFGQVLSLS